MYSDEDIYKEDNEFYSTIVENIFSVNRLQKSGFFSVDNYIDIPISEIIYLFDIADKMASKLNVETEKAFNKR